MPQISIFYLIKWVFLLRKLFKGGNSSRAETICGNTVIIIYVLKEKVNSSTTKTIVSSDLVKEKIDPMSCRVHKKWAMFCKINEEILIASIWDFVELFHAIITFLVVWGKTSVHTCFWIIKFPHLFQGRQKTNNSELRLWGQNLQIMPSTNGLTKWWMWQY